MSASPQGFFSRLLAAPERRQRLALALLSAALFLPGLTALPATDRDESRIAQSSKQMLASGNFVDVRLQDRPRYNNPAGIHWLQSAAAFLAGGPARNRIWPYRVPSLIAAIVAVQLLYGLGRRLFDGRVALIGAALFASCLLFGVEARIGTTDAALLVAVLAAQSALARLDSDRRAGQPSGWRTALLFWASLAAGLLIKGPPVLLASVGTLLALVVLEGGQGWWRRLRPLAGLGVIAIAVGPWLLAMDAEARAAFLDATVGRGLLSGLIAVRDSHGAPPGAYLLASWALLWPASLPAALAIPWARAHWREPGVRFLLAWIVPAWLLVEFAATKQPQYVLPLFPAIALLAAAPARDGVLPRRAWRSLSLALWVFIGLALVVAVASLPWDLGRRAGMAAGVTAAVVVALIGFLVLRRRREGVAGMTPALVLMSLMLQAGAFQWVLPRVDALWPSRAVARAVRAARGCPEALLAAAGYREPSLVFELGEKTKLTNAEGAAAHLLADPRCALALVEAAQRPAFLDALSGAGATPVLRSEIAALGLAKGERLDLELYSLAPE